MNIISVNLDVVVLVIPFPHDGDDVLLAGSNNGDTIYQVRKA
jgi:hypothetical protein